MDDQLSDRNARDDAENDDWSPSDGQNARRYWLAVARRGLAEGRQTYAERQKRIDERDAKTLTDMARRDCTCGRWVTRRPHMDWCLSQKTAP